jgi:hypothetical protein
MFRPKIKLDVFFFARKAADELSAGRWWGGSDLEETRKHVFRGERGPGPPNFGPQLISTDPKRGRGFLAPPNIWSHEDLSPIHDICVVLRRFAAFCGKLATTAHEKSNFASMKKITSSFY